MSAVLESLMQGFPVFISHFAVAVLMLMLAVYIYEKVTPYDELALAKQGNLAAAISLSAGILGLAIPLAACLAGSVNIWDIVIWGIVILVIQILAFFFASLVIDNLKDRIEQGEVGPAILLFSGKVSVGLLNAAAISG